LQRNEEALTLLNAALDVRVQAFGWTHPDVADTALNAGVLAGRLGSHQLPTPY
jgi:hypothetical protein